MLALAGCTVTAPDRDSKALLAHPSTGLSNTGDVEHLAGKYVFLDGVLDHQQHVHGFITLASGLKLAIPNFHAFAKKAGIHAWGDFIGRRVRVAGWLHAVTRDLPGWDGPAVEIHEFAAWPP